MYNPYQHAYELGLSIKWGKTPEGTNAFYDHASHSITLAETLTARQANCLLAHEIVHAEFADDMAEPLTDKQYARLENSCDKIAAKRLIIWPALVDAIKMDDDPRVWCAELNVMPWVLNNFFQDLTPQERLRLQKDTGKKISKALKRFGGKK